MNVWMSITTNNLDYFVQHKRKSAQILVQNVYIQFTLIWQNAMIKSARILVQNVKDVWILLTYNFSLPISQNLLEFWFRMFRCEYIIHTIWLTNLLQHMTISARILVQNVKMWILHIWVTCYNYSNIITKCAWILVQNVLIIEVNNTVFSSLEPVL